jgi:hypothetical protein
VDTAPSSSGSSSTGGAGVFPAPSGPAAGSPAATPSKAGSGGGPALSSAGESALAGTQAGGSDGTGGAAGTGGLANSVCAPDCPKRATASLGLIDDLEPGTTMKLAGGWLGFDDGSGVTSPKAGAALPESTLGVDGPTLAISSRGTGHSSWGGGLRAWLDGCTDISAFSKLKFMAKGSGSFTVSLVTFETNNCREGGGCATGCANNTKPLAVDVDWHEHEIVLSSMAGGSSAFSKLKVQGFAFAVAPPAEDPFGWELWLDDVRLE